MDLATIAMDRNEARKAFLDYKHAVAERHDDEDAQIMAGYRELARGRQLINLHDTIRAGGVVTRNERRWIPGDAKALVAVSLPALAVMRADQAECWVNCSENGTAVFVPHAYYRGWRDRVRVPAIPGMDQWARDYRAMVPLVPPALRPKRHLRNYHILWEADWAKVTPPRPPGDPALLKRIGGDLYAVLAIWDLTELERAVLAGRTNR